VWRIFNKRPEDFESLDAYNDYLESVEDIIFDLVNNENIQAIEDKIEEYRKENAEIIQRNIQKEMNEEMMLQQVLETQNREYQETLEQDLKERQLEQTKKLSRKTELIQQIAVSRKKATDILPAFIEEVSHAGAEGGKTSVKFASGKRGLSIQKQIEMNKKRLTEVVKYSNPFEDVLETPYNRDNDSPLLDISAYRDPSVVSFVMDKQAQILAGGFSVNLIYKRAIQSLQFGIFVEPVHEEQ
jgi:CDK-activating kinase assembly factor MAT1